MANFRRRRPRYATRGNFPTTTVFRKRHGFKPIRIPSPPNWRAPVCKWQAWRALWRHPYAENSYKHEKGKPAWFDRVFHSRPRRAREKRIEAAILRGAVDPDAAIWPLDRKPVIYFY